MHLEVLQNDGLRLTVAPELGASIVGLELFSQGFWLPLLRPTAAAALAQRRSPETSSYPLAPYSNRIREGRFVFAGRTYQLKPNWADGQTLHGEAHSRPWAWARQDEKTLFCRFDSSRFAEVNFPFPFAVELTYRLLPQGLEIHTRLQNTGQEPMPAGMGHHPYFMRFLGYSEEARLQFRARRVYLTDQSCLPTQPAQPLPPGFDFSQPKPVGSARFDHVFAGWEGWLELTWPGSGWRLRLEAEPIFSHLVLFTAPDGSLALEPVTHATDGFNLLSQGWSDTGVRVLEPEASLEGRVWLELGVGEKP